MQMQMDALLKYIVPKLHLFCKILGNVNNTCLIVLVKNNNVIIYLGNVIKLLNSNVTKID